MAALTVESMTVAWPRYVHMDVHSHRYTHRTNKWIPKSLRKLIAVWRSCRKNQFLNTFDPCASKLNIARGRLRALTLLAGEIAMVTLARPMPPICTALLRVPGLPPCNCAFLACHTRLRGCNDVMCFTQFRALKPVHAMLRWLWSWVEVVLGFL